jgi:Kef-type K+ transport system membrane component KefB
MPYSLGGDGALDALFAVLLLFVAASALGALARRFDQPAIVGEIIAGVLLGPSVLGAVFPSLGDWLGDQVAGGLAGMLAWLGAVLLLAAVGAEVDLALVGRLWKRHPGIPAGTLAVPMLAGLALGFVAPASLIGPNGDRGLLVAFLAVVLAISALPVVARLLMDLGWVRRDVGQLALSTAMADDVVGWLVLGVLVGTTAGGGLAVELARAGVLVAGLAAALAVGPRLVDFVGWRVARMGDDGGVVLTTATVLGLVIAAWAAGLDGLVGAFVAGVVLRRAVSRPEPALRGMSILGRSVLGPLFFATSGALVDVTAMGELTVVAWTVAATVLAIGAKLMGATVGASRSGPSRNVALAVGAAVSARGGMGVIAAGIGLSVGLISATAFSSLIVIAVATSVAAPPLTRRFLSRVPVDPDESVRLAREALLGESVLSRRRRVLLPTRGGAHARVAARILDLGLDQSASITVLHVADHLADPHEAQRVVDDIAAFFGTRRVETRVLRGSDPGAILAEEARHGYDLVAVGASHEVRSGQHLSATLQDLLSGVAVPTLIVRAGDVGDEGLRFGRIITPATGTRFGRAAEELAFEMAARAGAEVHLVHVVNRSDRMLAALWRGGADDHPVAREVLQRATELAGRFGASTQTSTRVGSSMHEQLLEAADERDADFVILAAPVQSVAGQPFLGHGIEFLLEHARQTLAVIAFPSS